MTIDLPHFTPLLSLAGGVVIGVAAALLWWFNGRVAGISGILGGLLTLSGSDTPWRLMFVIGMLVAPLLAMLIHKPPVVEITSGWSGLLIAGFLVGIGTRYAGGCTSGHGVCGLSRGSARSLVATLTFMVFGFLTVYVRRHLIGG